jgi:hypothetical protein
MKKEDWIFLTVIAGFLIWWLLDQNNKKGIMLKSLIDEREKLNEDLKQLKETLDKTSDLTDELKIKLNELISKYQNVDPNVASELSGAFVLIEIRQPVKAMLSLGKIIENQLKKLFAADREFKSQSSKSDFSSFLEYAKKTKVLNKEEYHYANAIREIRNQEAHELNVQKNEISISSGLLIATDLILKLDQIGRDKSLTPK